MEEVFGIRLIDVIEDKFITYPLKIDVGACSKIILADYGINTKYVLFYDIRKIEFIEKTEGDYSISAKIYLRDGKKFFGELKEELYEEIVKIIQDRENFAKHS